MDAMGIQHPDLLEDPHPSTHSRREPLSEASPPTSTPIKSSSNSSSKATDRSAPPRKRRRLVVSCTECHRRKQKCDRDLPCANCRSRNKEDSCTYETEPKARKDRGDKEGDRLHFQNFAPSHSSQSASPVKHGVSDNNGHTTGSNTTNGADDTPMANFAASLGYSSNTASTMSFLKRLEAQDSGSGKPTMGVDAGSLPGAAARDTFVTKEKFRGLIRQLPAKSYMDKLIPVYFSKFNYQYYALDPDVFDAQLAQWHALPFKLLSTEGPAALSPDMKVFPAMLFQILAIALLIVPEGDAEFEGLKYAGNMSFEDLALDYSESGMGVVALFEKKDLSLTTVQAEFLRATFLKFTAHVTESWHAVSMAIKDAQELGMHSDSLDPKPVNGSAEAALENQWLVQRRRRMYLILYMWDISMTIFLGRPGTINKHHGFPTLPVDIVVPKNRSREPVVLRNEWRDPPTPLTGLLWLCQILQPLFEIQDLEREGPHPKDPSKVDDIHRQITSLEDKTPAIFRAHGSESMWDDREDMQWVRLLRWYYASQQAFNRMALHRPYVFHRKQSRDEALKASLDVLDAGKQMFTGLPQDHWRNYHLFFGSFDALVMLSSIYTIFPREYPEYKQRALQQFHWTIERFSAMQERNPLARSAQGVLKAILAKFTAAISKTPEAAASFEGPTPPSTTHGTTPTSSNNNPASSRPFDQGLIMNDPEQTAFSSASADWTMPSLDALASIQPMYPTYDLLFNDLDVFPDGSMPLTTDTSLSTAPTTTTAAASSSTTSGADSMPWQFGGGFGEDTVWQFLNHYQPGTSGG